MHIFENHLAWVNSFWKCRWKAGFLSSLFSVPFFSFCVAFLNGGDAVHHWEWKWFVEMQRKAWFDKERQQHLIFLLGPPTFLHQLNLELLKLKTFSWASIKYFLILVAALHLHHHRDDDHSPWVLLWCGSEGQGAHYRAHLVAHLPPSRLFLKYQSIHISQNTFYNSLGCISTT